MRSSIGAVVLVASLTAFCAVAAAEDIKSGPQAGEPFAGAFNVKAVTGDVAGNTLCFT